MRLERLSAFVQSDGILKVDLALFQTGNDGLKLLERGFEAYVFDRLGWAFWGLGNGGTPTVSSFRNAPKPQCTIIAIMVLPKPASCPRTGEIIVQDSPGTSSFLAKPVTPWSRTREMRGLKLNGAARTAVRQVGHLAQDGLEERNIEERFDPLQHPKAGLKSARQCP